MTSRGDAEHPKEQTGPAAGTSLLALSGAAYNSLQCGAPNAERTGQRGSGLNALFRGRSPGFEEHCGI
ncbi:MAG: hypothetical protein HY680_08855 [Chloroflexi bacterium]|nr:hypothetical protein [Chloroflexota bacterium]